MGGDGTGEVREVGQGEVHCRTGRGGTGGETGGETGEVRQDRGRWDGGRWNRKMGQMR